MNLSQEDFKDQFFSCLEYLAQGPKNKKYKIYSFENNKKWFGVNLSKIKIKASNEYDCWLQLHKKLYINGKINNNEPYNLYDYDFITECALNDPPEEINMNYIVTNFIRVFVENDTLWCEEYS